jgi:deazaflavin-dependent oxidoreductase (nitroreductase family)
MFTATSGRVGNKVAGMPVVMLTTTGRKSGRKRTTMLTTPVASDDQVILVASYGGDPRHPKWFLNLRDNPEVELTRAGKRRKMHARVATPEERDELWPKVTGTYRGYAQYQTRTTRDIPLVILEPA